MRRKPMDVAIDKYRKCTDIRKVHPILFFEDCDKCGDEVKREPMWRAIIPHMMFSGCRYIYGCTTCFPTKEDFIRYLEKTQQLLSHDDEIFLRNLNKDDATDDELKRMLLLELQLA